MYILARVGFESAREATTTEKVQLTNDGNYKGLLEERFVIRLTLMANLLYELL